MGRIKYKNNGKIERRFTPEWEKSGSIDIEEMLPKLALSATAQIKSMVKYIEELHNEIDRLKAKSE